MICQRSFGNHGRPEKQIPESEVQEVPQRADSVQQSSDSCQMPRVRNSLSPANWRISSYPDDCRRSHGLSFFLWERKNLGKKKHIIFLARLRSRNVSHRNYSSGVPEGVTSLVF